MPLTRLAIRRAEAGRTWLALQARDWWLANHGVQGFGSKGPDYGMRDPEAAFTVSSVDIDDLEAAKLYAR